MLGEEAAAVLFEKRRRAPLHDGFFEALPGGLPGVDLALHPLTGELERVPTHGRVGGQRHLEGDLKRLIVGIHEALAQRDVREATPGRDRELAPTEREGAAVRGDELATA